MDRLMAAVAHANLDALPQLQTDDRQRQDDLDFRRLLCVIAEFIHLSDIAGNQQLLIFRYVLR